MTGPPAAPAPPRAPPAPPPPPPPAGAPRPPTPPLTISHRRIASSSTGLVRTYTRPNAREVPPAPAANPTPGVPRAVPPRPPTTPLVFPGAVPTRPLAVADAAALRTRRDRHRDALRRDGRVGGAARGRLGHVDPPREQRPPPPHRG